VRDGLAIPREIWPLHPERIRISHDLRIGAASYEAVLEGQTYRIPIEDMIHLRTWNPQSAYWGCSVIHALRNDIASDRHATSWNRAYFEKGGLPSVWFQPEEDLSPQQLRSIRKTIATELGGLKNQGLPGILPMAMKAFVLATPHKDIEWLAGQRWSREKIGTALGVPPFLMGQWESVAYANVDAQRETFWLFIEEELQSLLDELNAVLAPEYDELYEPARLRIDSESIERLQESRDRRTERVSKLRDRGIITINEAREELGWSRSEDEGADVMFVPAGMVPLEQALEPPEPPAPPPGMGGLGGQLEEPSEGDRPSEEDEPQEPAARAWYTPAQKAALKSAADRAWRRSYAEMERAAQRAVSAWGEDYLEQLEREPSRRPNADALAVALYDEVGDARVRIFERHARATLAGIAGGRKALGDEVLDPEGEYRRRLRSGDLFQNLRKSSNRLGDELARILEEMQADERPIADIQAAMEEVLGDEDHPGAAAERVAQTETTSAANLGNVAGYEAAGVEKKGWLTVGLDDVRETHMEQEAAPPVPVDQDFPIVGGAYPGDPKMPAQEAVNCRCTTYPVFEDEAKSASFAELYTKAIDHEEEDQREPSGASS
jgi:HK97 family phage portal protein